MYRSRYPNYLLIGLLLFTAGCTQQDTECLGKIGKHSLGKVGKAAGLVKDNVFQGWQGAISGDELAVAARVSSRLKWDKGLTDCAIEVVARGGTVDLVGRVNNLEQRQRALRLAESTLGVERAVDMLQEGGAAPY